MEDLRLLIKDITYKKEEVDRFLDATKENWARFNGEVGYLLNNSFMRDGVDDSYTIATYRSNDGARTMVNYREKPCRINVYGNSFTQCHQVSDGETWEEYLAAHFGEPIRNYGIGGHGVYQSYIRMLNQEEIAPVEYVILNIWSDDHYRSIDRWRWIRIDDFRESFRKIDVNMFHANPWSYLRLDENSRQFKEYENEFGNPLDLYKLCDEDYVYEKFQNDLIIHLELAKKGKEFRTDILEHAGKLLNIPVDFSTTKKVKETVDKIHTAYALRSSMYIVNKTLEFTKEKNKKLMILLSYSAQDILAGCIGEERFDKEFIDYLKDNNIDYIDMLECHKKDYKRFKITPEEYIMGYYINGVGHYNPKGNHFFAFSIKDKLLNWLNPVPITYCESGEKSTDIASFLA